MLLLLLLLLACPLRPGAGELVVVVCNEEALVDGVKVGQEE